MASELNLIGLAAATFILGMSPGPAVFATLARSLQHGLGHTYLFIIGIVAGDFLFAMIAMLGLAALAAAWNPLFLILKLIGGGYLLLLARQSWRDSTRPTIIQPHREQSWKLVASGFILTANNPKDLLFFVGFLPVFINLETAGPGQMSAAAAVIVLTFIVTLSLYALGASWAKRWLAGPHTIRWLNRLAAILLASAAAVIFWPLAGEAANWLGRRIF